MPLAPFLSNESCARTQVRRRFWRKKPTAIPSSPTSSPALLLLHFYSSSFSFSPERPSPPECKKSQCRSSCLLPPPPSPAHPLASARVKEFARARCPCSLLSCPPPQILRLTHTHQHAAGQIRSPCFLYPSRSWLLISWLRGNRYPCLTVFFFCLRSGMGICSNQYPCAALPTLCIRILPLPIADCFTPEIFFLCRRGVRQGILGSRADRIWRCAAVQRYVWKIQANYIFYREVAKNPTSLIRLD